MSIDMISEHLNNVCTLIEREMATSAHTVMGRTSPFWSSLFDERPNFPDITAFLGFRRDNFGYGMADERQGDLDRERDHFYRNRDIFRFNVQSDRMRMLDEPALGAPYAFEADGLVRSAAFWTNAATACRVHDFIEWFGPTDRPLTVLEIGAGWGAAAYQLHHMLDVRSYAIVDLPQNLLLSTVYLASTLGRALTLVSQAGEALKQLPEKSVCGLLPSALPRLTGSFDLILNSFSLQEMEADTVEAYLDWIGTALATDGIFVSFNSHGKAGIRRPSQYRYERFAVRHIGMFRRFPSGFLNTIPAELVLQRRGGEVAIDAMAIESLCVLFQLGLGDNLIPYADALITGSLALERVHYLHALLATFSSDPAQRHKALSDIPAGDLAIKSYLHAHHLLTTGATETAKVCLQAAIDQGLAGFARLRAETILAIIDGRKTVPALADRPDVASYPEAMRMLEQGDLAPILRQYERIMDFR